MRVLSVGYPAVPVGAALGGGAEQILSILDSGLTERGYQSTVVAASGSKTTGELIETPGFHTDSLLTHHRNAIERALGDYRTDIIHFHGLNFYEYVPDCDIPMVATLHLPISFYPAPELDRCCSRGIHLNYVSHTQAGSDAAGRKLPVILNGVPTELYAPGLHRGDSDFLFWLGRICPEKGVHIALDVAHRLDARMIIAGPVHPYPDHLEYFSRCVAPQLDDKRTYVGPVNLEEKRELLGRARCLLIPSLVAETSSLAGMEALSCATPVVAFRAGAIPEVIEDGETGYVVDCAEEMAEAVEEIGRISRGHCRERAVERFDSRRMIEDYLALYRSAR